MWNELGGEKWITNHKEHKPGMNTRQLGKKWDIQLTEPSLSSLIKLSLVLEKAHPS